MIEKLYSAASDVIEKTLKKEASMKSLCFSHHFRNKKLLFALVVETLKCKLFIPSSFFGMSYKFKIK